MVTHSQESRPNNIYHCSCTTSRWLIWIVRGIGVCIAPKTHKKVASAITDNFWVECLLPLFANHYIEGLSVLIQ